MELLLKYGISLIFVVVLLEQLGFPIPALPFLLLGGALAAGGKLPLLNIFVVAAVAAFIGDFLWYLVGRKKGRGILKLLCRISLNPDSCVRKTEESFLEHGVNSLMYAKFVPGLNTIAPPMAGTVRTSYPAFLWRDLIGILLYLAVCILPGYFFQKDVFNIDSWVESAGRYFFYLLIAAVVVYVLYKYIVLKKIQRELYEARITPQELHDRISKGEPIIVVDLRAGKAHIEGTLPGAIAIPPGEIDNYLDKLDKDKWIVMYCT